MIRRRGTQNSGDNLVAIPFYQGDYAGLRMAFDSPSQCVQYFGDIYEHVVCEFFFERDKRRPIHLFARCADYASARSGEQINVTKLAIPLTTHSPRKDRKISFEIKLLFVNPRSRWSCRKTIRRKGTWLRLGH